MKNDCQPEQSIIRNYSKLTDNQLEVNIQRGYKAAMEEKKRRQALKSQIVRSNNPTSKED